MKKKKDWEHSDNSKLIKSVKETWQKAKKLKNMVE